MAFARARGAVRFGAVAAAVLMSGGLTALPAGAAGTSGGSHFAAVVSSPAVTVLPQSSGAQAQRFHPVRLMVIAEDAPLRGVTVAVDASRAAGVAELSLPAGCSFTDALKLHARCAVGAVTEEGDLSVGLRSASGAALGAQGTVRFTVTATGATEDPMDLPTTTQVTVGSGPDLAVGPLAQVLDVKPGQTLPVAPTVQNHGDRDATGTVLVLDTMDGSGGFGFGGDFGNCRYGGVAAVVCRFDTVIKPGESYRLSVPVPLTASPHATGSDAMIYGWDVKGGLYDRSLTGGTPGKGAPLTLVQVPPAARAHTSIDINYDDNLAVSQLHLVTQDDVDVIAPHTITGTVGHTVDAVFGVRNSGTVPTRPFDGAPDVTAGLLVFVPKGVSVAKLPTGCEKLPTEGLPATQHALPRDLFGTRAVAPSVAGVDPGAIDGTPYACAVRQVLKPGQQATFTFALKPTRALKAAAGLAVAVGQPDDNTPDNNIAEYTVTATKATPAGTPSPSASRSATPSAAPTPAPTGGLAHTGGGSDALPLAAAGAGAVVLGAGAVLLARRRRGTRG
ncbi:hypothetical protein DN069_37355 [Streptacidiphilus pinicola]|uniref:Gram-positive cocci surface proteins LPxTG domain-containing protein n=1 Tax=Streptacidiphilus pinicola TaxID=2219663 RepID=A0A2X0ISS0_9ACTN|nr:LPXTG cell wall anchor domain-containing protein [Streptacidiphilus pinicola]RAG80596.1 hypothetical protein DN069_37355 [Streptacidiphilus pinicola]